MEDYADFKYLNDSDEEADIRALLNPRQIEHWKNVFYGVGPETLPQISYPELFLPTFKNWDEETSDPYDPTVMIGTFIYPDGTDYSTYFNALTILRMNLGTELCTVEPVGRFAYDDDGKRTEQFGTIGDQGFRLWYSNAVTTLPEAQSTFVNYVRGAPLKMRAFWLAQITLRTHVANLVHLGLKGLVFADHETRRTYTDRGQSVACSIRLRSHEGLTADFVASQADAIKEVWGMSSVAVHDDGDDVIRLVVSSR